MKKAVMYGAGNIGRGFIGQLLSQSGYEVIFLDINDAIINTLNKDKQYTVTTVSNHQTNQITIKNIRAINTITNEEQAIKKIADCDIMATAVGANIIKYITPLIAKGLLLRDKDKKNVLNILLCENLMYVNTYMKDLLSIELKSDAKHILSKVGLVEASIGRMVPVMSEQKYPTDITVEEFEILHTDKDGYVGDIPKIRNMIAYAPFEAYIQRKLFMHNMGHAVTAYLGALKGYQYIHEAINDSEIKYCTYSCGIESAQAISAGDFPLKELIQFYDRLIYRFNNHKLKDTIARVGRDPKRKLAPNDRITGSINLCKKHQVPYSFLLIGIAGALLFKQEDDLSSQSVYHDAKSDLRQAIITYTGMTDKKDIQSIITIYNYLDNKDIFSTIQFCETLKASKIKDS